jgi:putative transposase
MSHTELAKYPTDLTDEQWQILRKLLPQPSRRGAPQTVYRLAVINGILYVSGSGCAWRFLPREFPNWKTVYGLFLRWRNDGTWQRIHDTLRDRLRCSLGRKKSPGAAIIDSETVKTTEVGGQRGYDAGKKVNGRKRHIVVDTIGLILALVVHPANVQDYDGALLALSALGQLKARLHRLRVIFADAALRPKQPAREREKGLWVVVADFAEASKGQWVCGVAEALDRRAHNRLVGALSAPQQGLRTQHRIE